MTEPGIQVAFPKQVSTSTALVIPEAPITPANEGLAVHRAETPAEMRKTLSCAALLTGDTRLRADKEAADLLEKMLTNTQVFSTYGTSALQGVNDLIDRMLTEVEPTKVPEMIALMQGLNDEMRGIKAKHDLSDPKVREKYEKMRDQNSWIRGLLGRVKTQIEMLWEDAQSIEKQLERVEKELIGRQDQLTQNIGHYDQLYVENEAEILKLIYVIGVMELIRDLAAKRGAEIVEGDSFLGDRGGEQKAKVLELSKNMEIKIGEYKGRLMVAWATSPQVRTMRTLDAGLGVRLDELVRVTIPTMKATIVQWRMLIQAQDANQMAEAVARSNNEWLQAYAGAGAKVVQAVAEGNETPSLAPTTIAAMADSIAQQTDSAIHAMELGEQHREEMDQAMIEAKTVIDVSTKKANEAVIKNVLKKAHRAEEQAKEIEVETTVVG